jgi:hypothetical protein
VPTDTETPAAGVPSPLSVGPSCPFVYVNDQNDNYNAELALAMASRGYVDLVGFLFGYAGEPWLTDDEFATRRDAYLGHHRTVHQRARASGFTDLPPPEVGVVGDRHERPASGAVPDTSVIGSPGTDRIVQAAREASPERPLVVVVGSDLCTVADAYLTDPSIAERLVVYLNWTGEIDELGYNLRQSGWSAFVVLQRLSTALVGKGAPLLTVERVRDLPDTTLRRFMLEKEHFQYGRPLRDGQTYDGDSAAILAAGHPDTRGQTRAVRVTGETSPPFRAAFQVPTLSFGAGPASVEGILESRGLTEAYWSHLKAPETWG